MNRIKELYLIISKESIIRLKEIAKKVNELYDRSRTWGSITQMGDLLLEAKLLIPYGYFEIWKGQELIISTSTIGQLIKIASVIKRDRFPDNLPITKIKYYYNLASEIPKTKHEESNPQPKNLIDYTRKTSNKTKLKERVVEA